MDEYRGRIYFSSFGLVLVLLLGASFSFVTSLLVAFAAAGLVGLTLEEIHGEVPPEIYKDRPKDSQVIL